VADVDVAVGVGRAVVEDEALGPGALLAEALVQPRLLPAGEDRGFLGRQAGLHREVGPRKEDRVFIIGFFGHWRAA
jgi:hypothetical protein